MTTHGVNEESRARYRGEAESGTWAGQGTNFYASARRRSLEHDNRRSRRSGGGRRRRPWPERLCDGLRSFVAFLFSNVGIVCLVIGYTIAGAFIFVAIESSHEHVRTVNVSTIRNTTATKLWQLTSEENTFSEKIWKAKVDTLLKIYQAKIVDAVKVDDYDGDDTRVKNEKWAFAGAFLYSLTVITTIGYGNSCPRTMWGKVVTIVYAIFGMPLFLLYLSNIGDILARSFKWTYARCCLCRCRTRARNSSYNLDTRSRDISLTKQNAWQVGEMSSHDVTRQRYLPPKRTTRGPVATTGGSAVTTDIAAVTTHMVRVRSEQDSLRNTSVLDDEEDDGSEEATEEDDADEYDPQQITVPVTLCLAIMVGYICGGAQLFSKWEDWNFLDGSYFCFVSLSTIGFGDIVPGDEIYAGQGLALSSVFCSMYLMLGMALIAMCFNLMQEEVVSKIRLLTRSVKHILNCDR